jgi:putative DNA primase/helicase
MSAEAANSQMIDAAMRHLQSLPEPGNTPPPPTSRHIPPIPQEMPCFPNTDLGNAERLAFRHGPDLRYCHAWKGWLIWDGTRWKSDDSGEIFRRIAETVRSIYNEASEMPDKESRRAIASWAKSSESRRAISAMEGLAQNLTGIPVAIEQLDSDDYLLNCQNGTVDLRTGKLELPCREHLITKLAPTIYAPEASAELWDRFVCELMLDRLSLVDYLQRSVGYSLTANITEKVVFICHGGGNNGKTTFLETLKTALGDYAGQVLIESLMVQKNSSGNAPSPDIADLRGLRFVTSSESEDGSRLAEGKVKYLTGMNRVKARRLHENGWEFRPTWKLWMDCNHLPNIRGSDKAIWSRIKRIPFDLTLEPEQVDQSLPDRLKLELSGVLRWAVEGCMSWSTGRLGAPEEVAVATNLYHSQMDVIGRFLGDCTKPGLPSNEVKARTLYRLYNRWCSSTGEFAISERVFGERLADRGISKRHAQSGTVYGNIYIAENALIENEGFTQHSMVTGDRC